ncbi:hypothetical protein KSS87_009300 [Heliosperma pusillum]|nr:hypothetical protein KSS87_009300 [Heliosperma pusillum]
MDLTTPMQAAGRQGSRRCPVVVVMVVALWVVGNILYRFPSLQRTASLNRPGKKEYVGTRWSNWGERRVQEFFEEKKLQFSKTNVADRVAVIGLGALNLFGVIVLSTLLKDMAVKPNEFISFAAALLPLLQNFSSIQASKGISGTFRKHGEPFRAPEQSGTFKEHQGILMGLLESWGSWQKASTKARYPEESIKNLQEMDKSGVAHMVQEDVARQTAELCG